MPRRLLTVDQWRLRWLNKDLSLVVSSIACFNNGFQSDSLIYMGWSHHKQMHEHVFLLETLYPTMIINEELEWGCISFPGLLNTALMKNATTSLTNMRTLNFFCVPRKWTDANSLGVYSPGFYATRGEQWRMVGCQDPWICCVASQHCAEASIIGFVPACKMYVYT